MKIIEWEDANQIDRIEFSIAEKIEAIEKHWNNKELPLAFFQKMIGFMRTFHFFEGESISLIDLLIAVRMAESKREARDFIKGNAVSINNKKTNDVSKIVTLNDFAIEQGFLMIGVAKARSLIFNKSGI